MNFILKAALSVLRPVILIPLIVLAIVAVFTILDIIVGYFISWIFPLGLFQASLLSALMSLLIAVVILSLSTANGERTILQAPVRVFESTEKRKGRRKK